MSVVDDLREDFVEADCLEVDFFVVSGMAEGVSDCAEEVEGISDRFFLATLRGGIGEDSGIRRVGEAAGTTGGESVIGVVTDRVVDGVCSRKSSERALVSL